MFLRRLRDYHLMNGKCSFGWTAVWAFAVGAAFGCGNSSNPSSHNPYETGFSVVGTYGGSGPIQVAATTGMVADIVRQVAGERVNVVQLMGAGVDPHLYKATLGDVDRLKTADVIFYSGLHLEGKMGDILASMGRKKTTVAVASGIAESRLLKAGGEQHDPHVWFDVLLWSEAVKTVSDVLAAFDPPHAAEYGSRSAAYRAELASLDQECRERIATIPPERRVLVTAHDAFHYFGRTYNLEVKAIQGVSTESEAGVREINELVKFIVERKIKAVFVETSVNERNIQSLLEGCQALGHKVEIGGSLFSDAMDEPGKPGGTYVGMVRQNVDTIVKALK